MKPADYAVMIIVMLAAVIVLLLLAGGQVASALIGLAGVLLNLLYTILALSIILCGPAAVAAIIKVAVNVYDDRKLPDQKLSGAAHLLPMLLTCLFVGLGTMFLVLGAVSFPSFFRDLWYHSGWTTYDGVPPLGWGIYGFFVAVFGYYFDRIAASFRGY